MSILKIKKSDGNWVQVPTIKYKLTPEDKQEIEDAVVDDVGSVVEDAKQQIQQTVNAAKNNIDEKAAQAIASVPSDVTALNGTVSQLSESITEISEHGGIPFSVTWERKEYNSVGEWVDSTGYRSTVKYILDDVNGITVHAPSNAPMYAYRWNADGSFDRYLTIAKGASLLVDYDKSLYGYIAFEASEATYNTVTFDGFVKKLVTYSEYKNDITEIEADVKYIKDGEFKNIPLTITDGRYQAATGSTPSQASSCLTSNIPVIPGRTIKMSNLYLASLRAVCGFSSDGTMKHVFATDTTETEIEFVVPNDVAFIRGTGHVGVPPIVLQSDISLSQMRESFDNICLKVPYSRKKKIATWIDDDATSSSGIANVKAICDELGIKCTFAVITGVLSDENKETLLQYQNEGFHIANHTNSHTPWYSGEGSVPQFTLTEVEADLIEARKKLNQFGFLDAGKFLVYPGTSYNVNGIPKIVNKWCDCGVNIGGGLNVGFADGRLDIYRTFITKVSHPDLDYYKAILDSANDEDVNWMIFGTHSARQSDQWDASLVKSVLQYAINSGWEFMPLNEAWKYRKQIYDMKDMFA